MPIVPTYESRSTDQGLPSVQVHSGITMDMAAESTRGVESAAKALGQIVPAVLKMRQDALRREDEAMAKRAVIAASDAQQQELLAYGERKGLDANKEALAAARDNALKAVEKTRENLTSDTQREIYDGAMMRSQIATKAAMSTHYMQQMNEANRQESQAMIRVSSNEAVQLSSTYNVPPQGDEKFNAFHTKLHEVAALTSDANPGMPTTALALEIQKNLDSQVHEPVVKQMLANGTPANAAEYLKVYGTTMDAGRRAVLENAVKSSNEDDLSLRLFLNGTTMKEANQMFQDDQLPVGVRDKLQQRIEHAIVKQRTDHAQVVNDTREQLAAWALAPENIGKSPADMPVELKMSAGRLGLTGLVPQIQKHEISSEPGVVEEMRGRALLDPAEFSQTDLSKIPGLSWKDQIELGTQQKKIAQEGARYIAVDNVKRIAATAPWLVNKGINFGTKAGEPIDAETARFAGALQLELLRRSTLPNGTVVKLTADEEQKALAAVVAEKVVPGKLFGTNKEPAYKSYTPPAGSVEDARMLTAKYRALHGVPPDEQTLRSMLQNKTQRDAGLKATQIPK